MTCPKCFSNNVYVIGTSHYVCNNPECVNNGKRTQFRHVIDDKVQFPYNQIFVDRNIHEFYRKPYLELASTGKKEI